MRLAIILNNLDFQEIESNIVKILMFDVQDRVILSIGEETVSLRNSNYLILLLIDNEVMIVYADNLSPKLRKMLFKAGIEHKTLDELKDNPIFSKFLL